jgi:hypothetical protein
MPVLSKNSTGQPWYARTPERNVQAAGRVQSWEFLAPSLF